MIQGSGEISRNRSVPGRPMVQSTKKKTERHWTERGGARSPSKASCLPRLRGREAGGGGGHRGPSGESGL